MKTTILSLCLIPLLVGCESQYLLKTDFEADIAGDSPTAWIPGDPEGDVIWIVGEVLGEGSEDFQSPALVTSEGINGKSLKYSFLDLSGRDRQVTFGSTEREMTSPKYWAGWNGRISNFEESDVQLKITFGESAIGYASLVIKDGEFRTFVTNNITETIGQYSENENHTVIFLIDTAELTYSILIIQKDGSISTDPKPLQGRKDVSSDRHLYINLNSFGVGDGTYLMDDVFISENKPQAMQ